MTRPGQRRWGVFVLAALLALGTVGVALHQPSAAPEQLVNALPADELGKFGVVDMADALERTVAASSESR
jgi:hypothetical protein